MTITHVTTLAAGPSGLANIDIPRTRAVRNGNGSYSYVRSSMATGRVVYYLERGDGAVKIGTTGDLRTRRRGLAYEYGPLSLLAWESGSYDVEGRRHRTFWRERIADTEWFEPRYRLIKHVRALRAVYA